MLYKVVLLLTFVLLQVAATSAVASSNVTEVESSNLLSRLPQGFEFVDFKSDDVTLKSILFDPVPKDGSKNPVVIFISSWGMNKWEYVVPAREYAKKGYTVFSYTARGFWKSEGEISLAGEADQQDVRNAISWVIENTNADPDRIGLSGISYGGGLSLLGAAVDSRVKTAVSMSCWVDLAESFLGNGETIRTEAAKGLQVLGEITGNPSDMLEDIFNNYLANENLQMLYDVAVNSSVINFMDDLNGHNPAVFIANALGDSLFTPNQFLDFFSEGLKVTSKHLEFAPGDHAGPELVGLAGLPDQVWTRAFEWNDFYLHSNHPNTDDIHTEYYDVGVVVLNTMNGREVESYDSWAEVTTSTEVYSLAEGEKLDAVTEVGSEVTNVGSLTTGEEAGISGGVAYITSTVDADIDVQKPVFMRHIDRDHAVVFVAPSVRTGEEVHYRGVPVLDLNIIPQSTNGSLVVYLLGVDHLGWGHIFSFSPWTFKGATPNEEISLSIPITVTCYDIPEQYSLAVVIVSRDSPLYLDENPADLTMKFMSGSKLTMPINKN